MESQLKQSKAQCTKDLLKVSQADKHYQKLYRALDKT